MVEKHIASSKLAAQSGIHRPRQKQLLFYPHRHRLAKRTIACRRKREISLQQPLKFRQRLVVKRDVIELIRSQPRLAQAILDRNLRKLLVVLLPREPLLLSRRHNLAVYDQRRRRIVVESRDAENGGHELTCFPKLPIQPNA